MVSYLHSSAFIILFTFCVFWASAALTTQSFAQNNEFYNAYTPYEITSPVQRKTHSSALEKLYTERLSQEIEQFGYDLFTDSSASSDFESEASRTPIGAIQDSFILGLGDELLITFTGQRSDQAIYRVTSQGHIIIKDIPPLPATGKTLAQLHDLLNAQLATMPNTQSYISLSKVRQIGVLVVGHVKKPGRKTLNAFHSIIEALNSAGGITKDGSLRQIKLVRAGHSSIIDLYALLLDGAPQTDMTLKDGDRLIIPPVGPTLAIAGSVKRPGVYEIKEILPRLSSKSTADQNEKLTLDEMLKLSGGVLIPGQNRFIRINPEPNGQENIDEIDTHTTPLFSNGSILNVMSGKAKRTGTIKLTGQTRKPGLHDLSRNKTLAKLLSNPDILDDDIYPLLGVIERWDTEQFSTQYISFPVRSVLKNKFDLSLSNNDVIKLFSNQEISTLFKAYTSNTKSIKNNSKDGGISNDIYKDDDVLKIYLKEHSVHVRGAVRHPGHYPVAQGITLDNILAVAGGMTLEANRDSIEITSANFGQNGQAHERSGTQRITISLNETSGTNYTLSAGDSVRVNQQYRKLEEKTVHIKGEILHPGEYNLLPSDTISSLIQRAGGLTEQAYPTGAIFSRKSERRAEELRFRKAARNMELSLANAVKNDKNRPDATQIEMVRSLAQELTRIQAVGRITVETDPAVLSVKPELDMLLEHGDRLYVPKRPLSVRVTGEVLSPSALQFISDKAPLNYIHEAGSFTFHADKDRAFVLYPNGSAQPLQVNTWNHKPIFIPPGSTIVVPRDPAPFSFIDGAREIAQILSNLAVTAVFIDDIRD